MSSSSPRLRRVLPMTRVDFGGLAGSQTQNFLLGKQLEVSSGQGLDALVRLHTGTTIGTGASLTFSLHGDGYDFGDPTTEFATPLVSSVVMSAWTAARPAPWCSSWPRASRSTA